MKMIKWLFIFLIIVIVGTTVAAQVLVNMNFVRVRVEQLLKEQVKRDVHIGKLGVVFLPYLRMSVSDVTIQEKDKTPFVSVEKLYIRINLIPLLKKRVIIPQIMIVAPTVHVIKQNDGTYNFDDIVAAYTKKQPQDSQSAKPATQSSSRTTPGPAENLPRETASSQQPSAQPLAQPLAQPAAVMEQIMIDTITIEKGAFFYEEKVSGSESRSTTVKNLDIVLNHFSFTEQVDIAVRTDIGKAQLALQGYVGPFNVSDAEDIVIKASVNIKELRMDDIAAFIDASLAKQYYFTGLMVNTMVTGSLRQGIEIQGTVKTDEITGQQKVYIDGSLRASVKGMLSDMTHMLWSVAVDIKAGRLLYPGMPDPLVLTDSRVSMTRDHLMLERVALTCGKTAATLSGMIKNFSAPEVEFVFESSTLVLDSLIGIAGQSADAAQQKQAKKGPAEAGSGIQKAEQSSGHKKQEKKDHKEAERVSGKQAAEETPVVIPDIVKKMRVHGSMKCHKIMYGADVVESFSGQIDLKDGKLTFKDGQAKVFKGTIKTGFEANVKDPLIAYNGKIEVSELDIHEVLSAHLDRKDIFGRLTAQMTLQGKGVTRALCEQYLSGSGSVSMKDGKIDGINVKAEVLRKLDNPLIHQALPGLAQATQKATAEEKNKKSTTISTCKAAVTIKAGVVDIQNVIAVTDDISLTAAGSATFKGSLKLAAQACFSQSLTNILTSGKDVSHIMPYKDKGIMIPVSIAYPPWVVVPDIGVILSNIATKQINKKLDGLLDKAAGAGDKKGGKENPVQQVLGGLFGGNSEGDKKQESGQQKGLFGGLL